MASKNVIKVTDSNFDTEVLQSSLPVLAYFSAIWEGRCRAQLPIVESIADEFEGKIKVVEIDVDSNYMIAQKYHVWSPIPAILALRKGEKYGEYTGVTRRDTIVQMMRL